MSKYDSLTKYNVNAGSKLPCMQCNEKILNSLLINVIEGKKKQREKKEECQYSHRDWCGKRMTILFHCPYKYPTIEDFLSHKFSTSLFLLSSVITILPWLYAPRLGLLLLYMTLSVFFHSFLELQPSSDQLYSHIYIYILPQHSYVNLNCICSTDLRFNKAVGRYRQSQKIL